MTSGYRINSSADDAAGLAIANGLRSERTELNQGIQNANNAVSQLQIVDGGLGDVSQILDRLKTLAVQGASSTFTGSSATLANEMSKDVAEINRQAGNIGLATGGQNIATLVYVGGGLGNNGAQIGSATENLFISRKAPLTRRGWGSTSITPRSYLRSIDFGRFQRCHFFLNCLRCGDAWNGAGHGQRGINQLNFAVGLAQSQVTNCRR